MKVFSLLAFTLVFGAGFDQAAAGILFCGGDCVACWKIGSTTGEDIKFKCNLIGGCRCPSGYDRMHCATDSRCECPVGDCGKLGPCACGVATKGGNASKGGTWNYCKPILPSGKCPN